MEEQAWVYTDPKYGWVLVSETECEDTEVSPWGNIMNFVYNAERYSSNVVFGSEPHML
jgi:hypothetical protein